VFTCPYCGRASREIDFCDHCHRDLAAGVETVRVMPDLSWLGPPVLDRSLPEAGDGVRRYEGQFGSRPILLYQAAPEPFERCLASRLEVLRHVLPFAVPLESPSGPGGGPSSPPPAAAAGPADATLVSSNAHPFGAPERPPRDRFLLLFPGEPRGAWASSVARAVHAAGDDELVRLQRSISAVYALCSTVGTLHAHGLVWLGFDPGEVVPGGELPPLRLANALTTAIPAGQPPPRMPVVGRYAAPERARPGPEPVVEPTADVYALGALLYYLLAGLFPRGLPGGSLESWGFRLPPLRTFRPQLPPGIEPIVRRALDPRPGARFADASAFAEALSAALERARRRAAQGVPLLCEWAGRTTVGHVKQLLQPVNQDAIFPERGERPSTWPSELEPVGLFAVADGVSICGSGTGERASRLAVDALRQAAATLGAAAAPRGARDALYEAFERANGCVVQDLPPGTSLEPPGPMSTTLVASLVDAERARATIFNVGDSRAYLVSREAVESLTRDDDVETHLHLEGARPEDVLKAEDRRALRRVIGLCRPREGGGLEPDPERARPTVLEFGLLPGDHLLLCSDGLVEEGVFLSPEEVAHALREGAAAGRSLDDVVDEIVKLADSRQQPPRTGDNIACVAVRVRSRTGVASPEQPGETSSMAGTPGSGGESTQVIAPFQRPKDGLGQG